MSVYNEEKVLAEKLKSVLATSYPSDLWEIIIGSDGSTDRTNIILSEYALKYPENIRIKIFEKGSGKSRVLNKLMPSAKGDILILTDADAFFFPDTISELVRPFVSPDVGGVQAHLHMQLTDEGPVSVQEKSFHEREMMIKAGESSFGAIIGAEGACYALRKELYAEIPKGFINDDFFIFKKILSQGYKTILNPEAQCTRCISGDSTLQFRRKIRMAVGNYQILFHFPKFLNPFLGLTSYAYISHKVLRWVTPFLMLTVFGAGLWLAFQSSLYQFLFYIQVGGYLVALSDVLPFVRKLDVKILRFARHFIFMNAAVLVGFLNFVSNKKKISWGRVE